MSSSTEDAGNCTLEDSHQDLDEARSVTTENDTQSITENPPKETPTVSSCKSETANVNKDQQCDTNSKASVVDADDKDGISIINSLTDSLLLEILSYCDWRTLFFSTRLVCRRWFDLSGDRDVWTDKTVSMGFNSSSQQLRDIKALSLYAPIQDLCFPYMRGFSSADTAGLLQNCPSLTWLSLPNAGGQCGAEVFTALKENCPKLQSLRITTLEGANENKTSSAESFKMIAELTKLKELGFCNMRQLSESTVAHIFNNCKKLEKVVLRGQPTITETILTALSSLPKLRKLNLYTLTSVDNETLDSLGAYLPNLLSLNLHCLQNATSYGLSKLAKLKHLKGLSISVTPFSDTIFTAICLKSITLQCSRLTTLNLEGELENEDVLSDVCYNLKVLKRLIIWGRTCSDVGLKHIAENSHCLESLYYRGRLFTATITGAEYLLSNLPTLKYLTIGLDSHEIEALNIEFPKVTVKVVSA